MNLGTITKTNTKGQIVIPKKFRDELGINEEVLLNLSLRGNGVYISLLDKPLATSDSKQITLEILKSTAGAWKGDDWKETEKKRRRMELTATRTRKKVW